MAEGLRKFIGNKVNPWAWLNNLSRDHSIGFFTIDSTPVNGTSGTGAKFLGPGSEIFNTVNNNWYINIGTKASPNWAVSGGPGGTLTQQTVLTNTQVKNLRATPITLVAAPGAGLFINPIDVMCELVYGGTNAFTANVGDNLAVKWKDGTTTPILQGGLQAFLQGTASAMNAFVGPATGSDINVALTNVANQPLVIHNIGAAEIAGNAANDNKLAIYLSYQILPTF